MMLLALLDFKDVIRFIGQLLCTRQCAVRFMYMFINFHTTSKRVTFLSHFISEKLSPSGQLSGCIRI